MTAPCAIGAVGVVSALGCGAEETWPRLVAADQSGLSARDDLVPGRRLIVGEVHATLPALPRPLHRYTCRTNQLALVALRQIEGPLREVMADTPTDRVAVVVGTSTSGIASAEDALRERARSGRFGAGFGWGSSSTALWRSSSRAGGREGPAYTVSTACSSGAKALCSARSLLELGVCDAVVAGAIDSACALTVQGFGALQAISAGVTNPMSRARDGLTLGEGGALFLLTRERGGIQLLGAGESSDAHHMSAPDPLGRGSEACMRDALADAGLAPEQIAYLNLHGTGTPHNDSAEAAAVARVFGLALPCSSTKPLVGHALGASGAIEAAFCWMVLSRRDGRRLRLPPHRWDGERDPEIPALALTAAGACVEAAAPAALMSTSFGFGGNNCALVLGEERA